MIKKLYLLPVILFALSFTACNESEEVSKYENWQERNEAFMDSLARVYETQSEPKRLHRVQDSRDKSIYIYYKIIETGDTEPLPPFYTSKVSMFYRGMYINEEIFATASGPEYLVTELYNVNGIDIFDKNFAGPDPDYPNGLESPSTFGVNQVVTGWTEVLQIMRPGDRWEVYVPYQSGYGSSTSSSGVMAYTTLIFDMKMISIEYYPE